MLEYQHLNKSIFMDSSRVYSWAGSWNFSFLNRTQDHAAAASSFLLMVFIVGIIIFLNTQLAGKNSSYVL